MKVLGEAGVLPRSERFFATPSAAARRIFFYLTRCGHYYCDAQYDFRYTCAVGQEESHKNFYLVYVREGAMSFDADGALGAAARGQCALVDCRKPHRFWVENYAETIWLHFDGANSRALFDEIRLKNGGRHILTLCGGSPIERQMTALVASQKSGAPLREVDYSGQIYAILCALLYPEPPRETHAAPIAAALAYIGAHLFEELPVERIAAAVNLSPSHFSRQFRSSTGFSPHEYIVLHRIDRAKVLLHGSDLTVGEIAYRVGYRSEVNFITSFTNKVGVSPANFRRSRL